MRIRSLVIIILLLAAASAAAYFLKSKTLSRQDPMAGKPLFPSLPVNDVASFEIKSANNAVLLRFLDEQWVVANKSDYPADYTKVSNLLRGLKNAEIIRTSEGSPDELSRLALKDPDSGAQAAEKGSRVILKDQKGTVVASIVIGSERKTPEKTPSLGRGRFVKLPDDGRIYLVTGEHSLFDAAPLNWVDRRLLNVSSDDVKSISCYANDTNDKIFSYERPEKGENFKSTGPKYKYGDNEIYLLATGLIYQDLQDVIPADPEQSELSDRPLVFEYVTFDDMVYRVYPSQASPDSPQGQYSLSFDVACITASGDEECIKRANRLHTRLSPWIFKVNPDQYNRFFPNFLDTEPASPDSAQEGNQQQ